MNFKRIYGIIIRHLYNFKHNPDRLADSFYWPAMDIVLWGLTSQYMGGSSAGKEIPQIMLILLTGLIFWQVIWRGQYEITVNFLEELWSRNLVNLFATPLTVNEWISGVIILGIIKMVGTIAFVIGLTWILYTINIFTFGLLLIPFLISLIMTGWWIGLMIAGLLVRFGKQIQTLAWAGVYLLAPFSAIYYPVSSLPLWAQKIAYLLPTAYVFEGMRKIINSNKIPIMELVISLGINLFYLLLSYFFFIYCFNKTKEKGLAKLE